LRLELADFGVHVVIVEPAVIRTDSGDIAQTGYRTFSGDTAYAGHVAALERLHAGAYEFATGPEVIAEAIHRAATARRPRLRYVVPASTAVLLLAVRIDVDAPTPSPPPETGQVRQFPGAGHAAADRFPVIHRAEAPGPVVHQVAPTAARRPRPAPSC
jgi:hypothetical protein